MARAPTYKLGQVSTKRTLSRVAVLAQISPRPLVGRGGLRIMRYGLLDGSSNHTFNWLLFDLVINPVNLNSCQAFTRVCQSVRGTLLFSLSKTGIHWSIMSQRWVFSECLGSVKTPSRLLAGC